MIARIQAAGYTQVGEIKSTAEGTTAKAVKNGKTTAAYAEGPRYASLKGIMAAKKKPIEETTLAALGVKVEKKVKTTTLEAPPARKAGIKVATVEELVQKLHSEAKVI